MSADARSWRASRKRPTSLELPPLLYGKQLDPQGLLILLGFHLLHPVDLVDAACAESRRRAPALLGRRLYKRGRMGTGER